MRPLYAEVDLGAIRSNFDLLADKAGSAKCIAVVKADAYGHGIVQVAKALSGRASKLAVACLDEALELRAAGVDVPIMILEGFFSAEEVYEGVRAGNIEWVVHDESQLKILQALVLQAFCKIWIKINTGMNRLGFPLPQLGFLLDLVAASKIIDLQGVVTHFACADAPESGFFKQQLHSVLELRQCLSGKVPLSAANSAGVLLYPEVCFDWVRPGIALYGCSPVAEKQSNYFDLRPALMLKSEIIACRDLSQGESVGYGASWRACQPTRMGVVAIGYGDGYPRQICNGSPVIVAGTATRIIGRVSMDMVTVDLTPVNFAGVGSQVELWGKQLSVDRVARYANTISYHLLTGISKRVPRRYLGIAGGFQVEN